MASDFPWTLTLHIPFPTERLANVALRTISVDEELSPLVKRAFSLVTLQEDYAQQIAEPMTATTKGHTTTATTLSHLVLLAEANSSSSAPAANKNTLEVMYRATTNRMLRVAVNGFFDSLGVVMQVMEELDVDVLHGPGTQSLEGVQGIEQGHTGTATAGA